MRRGIAFVFSFGVLGMLTPAAFGQYPYPYGPMPMPYPPPYGYQMPMPVYGPNPALGQPMYYPPAAMMPAPAPRNTKVFVYGPLTDETVLVPPANPMVIAPPNPLAPLTKTNAKPADLSQAQAVLMRGGAGALPTFSKADLPPDACGPGCNDCGAACGGLQPYEAPMRGKGHFIGEVGAYFLTPIFNPHAAFTSTTAAGGSTTSDFPSQVDIGPSASVGYVFHSGWGIRGNYEYLRGTISQQANNTDPTTTITTPLGAFPLTSPSATLNAGLGVDHFTFRQLLELNVADVEFLKETHLLDTTFLFSFGARYARMVQSYTATRNNPGGSNGVITVAQDQEQVESANRFEGWGPTFCLEAVHPLGCGFSLYGNVRGSFLWGQDRFSQNDHVQNTTVNAAGLASVIDATQATEQLDSRFMPIFETEAGVQYGCRLGRCYLFARAGVVYQHWWDVGNPTASTGNMSFLGGVAKLGITY